jgi:MarR family transcriptional regulator, negative regulator of the multidrug operon emrRAB
MHDGQLVNILGALSLNVADLLTSSVTDAAGTSRSGAAAMAVLMQAGTPLNVTELGRRVGLSQPAAARMVDSLENAGLVRRRAGATRAVTVALTRTGRRSAHDLLARRSARLEGLLNGLSTRERETLNALLGKVVTNVYDVLADADLICRLCDRDQCVRHLERCPVGVAAGEPPGA